MPSTGPKPTGRTPAKAPQKATSKPGQPLRVGTKEGNRKLAATSTVSGHGAGKSKSGAVKGALAGAGAGAGSGAMFGPEGALIGAGLGAAGGAVSGRKQRKKETAARHAALGPGRQVLLGEFILCMVVLAFSRFTAKHKTESAAAWMKRGTAMCGLFWLLSLISTGGKSATRAAASFGGIVTLALVLNDRDIFSWLAVKVASPGKVGAAIGPSAGDIANGPPVHPDLGPSSSDQGVPDTDTTHQTNAG